MLTQRTKEASVVINTAAQSAKAIDEQADWVLTEVRTNRSLDSFYKYIKKELEWVCSFCGDYHVAKEKLFDTSGFPCCCEKAMHEFVKEHEQIFTDPENQPNQYGIGLCPCGKLYDQMDEMQAAGKMCETCLGDAQ
jgi:hypothetical protein